MNIALRFAYDGACFPNGYSRQPEGGTVEDALIAALRKEGYEAGSWKTGSRTDRGVCALENVAACRVNRTIRGLVPALQNHLPEGLWVRGVAEVEPDWNPRHHALRTYRYIAPNRGESLPALREAAERFVGSHDLSGFAKVEPHRNPQRIIETCQVESRHDHWMFTVASPGFLWNQVRRMVDAMLKVGAGRLELDDIRTALESGKPHASMKIVPAAGLLLQAVQYTPALEWNPVAGTMKGRHVAAAWQGAQVRAELLDALSASS